MAKEYDLMSRTEDGAQEEGRLSSFCDTLYTQPSLLEEIAASDSDGDLYEQPTLFAALSKEEENPPPAKKKRMPEQDSPSLEEELLRGLTHSEVSERKAKGQTNSALGITTKSIGKIIVDNVFTLFNCLNFSLAALIIWVGRYTQLGFLVLILCNIAIALIQEIRAKKTIDKLSLVSVPRAVVVREGSVLEISVAEVVLDDVLKLGLGNQICSDCCVLCGSLEVNESMVTGESDPVLKRKGDELLSGSFVTSGTAFAKVVRIGADNYASRITAGAKFIKQTAAEIPLSLKAVIRLMSFVVLPLGLGIFLKSFVLKHTPIDDSILKMTASVISMIPQGLVALSTVVFAASVVRLTKHRTLSQDLYCIETLARVDVLCLDKTGTITEGKMQLDEIIDIGRREFIEPALAALTRVLPDRNPTFDAIQAYSVDVKNNWAPTAVIPFSSARKWSGASFGGEGSYLIGASEFLLAEKTLEKHKKLLEDYAKKGVRILCLCHSKEELKEREKPKRITPMAFLMISDRIRKEAPLTLQYFKDQGVAVKIISGDNSVTVSAIATRAGLRDGDNFVDASTLPDEKAVKDAAEKYAVFGRVTPEQKLWIMQALKGNGHTVAMMGDGVNDVLALKEADCSIAMAEGSDAARTVSHLVLLDSNFAVLPRIVAEGRRTINNLQRTASLFLVKTIYSMLLAIFFLFVGEYPFEPMHLTLIGVSTSGAPAVLLALEPNEERVSGRFLTNVLAKSFPGAITIFICIVALQILHAFIPVSGDELSTVSVMLIAGVSFGVLFGVCRPFKVFRVVLYCSMLLIFFMGWNFFSGLFNLVPLSHFHFNMYLLILPILAVGIPLMTGLRSSLSKRKGEFRLVERILRIDKVKEK